MFLIRELHVSVIEPWQEYQYTVLHVEKVKKTERNRSGREQRTKKDKNKQYLSRQRKSIDVRKRNGERKQEGGRDIFVS
jgi:hypothetical protein